MDTAKKNKKNTHAEEELFSAPDVRSDYSFRDEGNI